ncbi:MAG: amidohydrolase family protein [Acidimicrobiia bacterium]
MGVTRVMLRTPDGELVRRDVASGVWGPPEGKASEIVGEGLWALPGLTDGHAHLARETLDMKPGDLEGARERARRALDAGVGLVLDKGWDDLTTVELIDTVPIAERPVVEAAGRICTVEDGYWPNFGRVVHSGEFDRVMLESVEEGRGWIKLVGDWPRRGIGPQPNFTERELEKAVEIAEAAGSRVAVHTMARDVPSVAVRAGVHSIEHGLFLTEGDLVALGVRGGSWVPTVVQVETLIRQFGAESSGGRLFTEGLANVTRLLNPAVEAGVRILTGTDLAVGTSQVALEAIRLWELGLDARSVVAAVSLNGLAATGRETGFVIGSPANVVMYDVNPAEDPRALAHPKVIMWHGRRLR